MHTFSSESRSLTASNDRSLNSSHFITSLKCFTANLRASLQSSSQEKPPAIAAIPKQFDGRSCSLRNWQQTVVISFIWKRSEALRTSSTFASFTSIEEVYTNRTIHRRASPVTPFRVMSSLLLSFSCPKNMALKYGLPTERTLRCADIEKPSSVRRITSQSSSRSSKDSNPLRTRAAFLLERYRKEDIVRQFVPKINY